MDNKKGFLALTAAAAVLGTFGVLIRYLSTSFSDSGQVFARSFFATVTIILIIFFKKINPFKIKSKSFLYVSVFSIVFPLSVLCFTMSANLTKVTNSLFMLYVGSLASTAVLGKLVFNESFGLKHLLSLALVLFGLSFFVYPFSFQNFSLGLTLGLASGVLEGASHVLRRLMKDIKREIVVFYQSLSGATVALVLLFLSGEVFIKSFNLSAIIVAVVFGVLLVVIGYMLVYGFGNFDVNLGTIILATELFFALVINALVLKEYPTSNELIGGILIFSGTVVASLNLASKRSK